MPVIQAIWEAEAGGFLSSRLAWSTEWVPGQPGLHSETLSPNKQTNTLSNLSGVVQEAGRSQSSALSVCTVSPEAPQAPCSLGVIQYCSSDPTDSKALTLSRKSETNARIERMVFWIPITHRQEFPIVTGLVVHAFTMQCSWGRCR